MPLKVNIFMNQDIFEMQRYIVKCSPIIEKYNLKYWFYILFFQFETCILLSLFLLWSGHCRLIPDISIILAFDFSK